MTSNDPTAVRLQLLASGYNPLPNHDKRPVLTGYNTPDYLKTSDKYPTREAVVTSWRRRFSDARSTGVRIENGLAVVDGDVKDDALAGAMWDVVRQVAPEIADRAPARYGGGEHKVAWFVRFVGPDPFVSLPVRKYSRPEHLTPWRAAVKAARDAVVGTDKKPELPPEPPYHQIEIFGGAPTSKGLCSRQFGVYGPHTTVGDIVKVEYRWAEGPELATTPLAQLPSLTKAQACAIIDGFEAAAIAAGFEALPLIKEGADGNAVDIYDIDPDATRFEVLGEPEMVDYVGLTELFHTRLEVRLTANFIPGEISTTVDRCQAFWSTRYDCLVVKDWKTAARHYPKDKAPGAEATKLAELLRQLTPPTDADEPPEPADDADLHTKAKWLVDTRAYCERDDKIVRIHGTTLTDTTAPAAFHRRFRHWSQPNSDKRFKRPIYATDLWEETSGRKNVAGLRMRPDQSFPLYTERGALFKNTYRRPVHTAAGDVAPFLSFLERFLPDPVEREWLLDWMAHKQARPEIPGTSVIFVADTDDDTREGKYGVGRSLLFRALHQLYGVDYARSEDFNILDGSSGQSAFTDWMHGTVLVTVDEAQTSATAYRRGERKSVYEVLKNVVDPAPRHRRFKVKHGQAFDGISYCSIIVATNHADAVAIPASDRRFTILSNGRVMTRAETLAMAAWLDGANVGALSQLLAARDLTGFDMFQPLATTAKAEMAELARSEVEEILRDLIEDEHRGLVFTKGHIEMLVANNFNGQGAYWRGEFKEAWGRYCAGLKTGDGGPRRVRMAGTQRKLFCFRVRRRQVESMPEAAIRREVAKWGGVDNEPGLGLISGLDRKD